MTTPVDAVAIEPASTAIRTHLSTVTGLMVFFALCILKWDLLHDPPAWDAAMGLFPAAITLAGSGFDYGELLAQPGFLHGGPNVHATSIYTLFVAGLIWSIGAPQAYIVLHIVAFATAGITAYALMRFVPPLTRAESAGAAIAAISLPVVVTQFSLIYVEAPLLATTALALSNAKQGRIWQTAGWALLATAIKPPGVIAAAVALTILAQSSGGRPKLRHVAVILGPSTLFLLFAVSGAAPGDPGSLWVGANMVRFSALYLFDVPDVLVLLVVGLLVVLHRGPEDDENERVWLPALFFFSVIAFSFPLWSGFAILPRYYVQIAPFVVIAILLRARCRYGSTAFWTVVSVLVIWSLANSSGRFYPDQGDTNFAAVERSSEYHDLLVLHGMISRYVADLPPSEPVYFGLPEHYRQSYPSLGYVDVPHPNGRFIQNRTGLDLTSLPNSAYLVLDLNFRGGIAIRQTYRDAMQDPNWTVETVALVSGAYRAEVANVRRK